MNKLQQQIQEWWNLNPMTYDWKKTLKVPEETREFFAEIDKRFFDAAFFAHQKMDTPFSKLIDYKALRGKQVLEIGCGTGALAAIFAQQQALISSIDLTHRAVVYTKRRFELCALKGNILQMDAQTLGFRDKTFDFVWSWGVIHHSQNPERIVSEMYRVLKPGGKASIMVYNRNSIYFWVYLMLFRGIFCGKFLTHSVQEICNRYSDGLIAKYYTPRQLGEAFRKSGFSAVKMEIYGQKADVYLLPGNIRTRFIQFIPSPITHWLVYNFGCFLYLTASKPK